jgi:hypothetical protein
MQRYLLFDADCSSCRTLAQGIAREGQGWLEIRSLRELEIQALLTQTHSAWKWEPTFLEVDSSDVRIYTGPMLRLKLLVGLGPRRAWRIAQLAYQSSTLSEPLRTSRRGLFKQTGLAIGGLSVVLGIGRLTPQVYAHDNTRCLPPEIVAETPNHQVIEQLQASPPAQVAKRHFGNLDWNTTLRVFNKECQTTVFLVPFEPAADDLTSFTVLAMDETLQVHRSFIARIPPSDPETDTLEFQWFTPEGTLFGVTRDDQGEVTSELIGNGDEGDFPVRGLIERVETILIREAGPRDEWCRKMCSLCTERQCGDCAPCKECYSDYCQKRARAGLIFLVLGSALSPSLFPD